MDTLINILAIYYGICLAGALLMGMCWVAYLFYVILKG
jgi:hypothetical protein